MPRVLKWVGYTLLTIVGLLIIVSTSVYVVSARILARTYAMHPAAVPLAIPAAPAAIAEGRRLATIRGCNGCHRPNLEGEVFLDQLMLARVSAPNLSRLVPTYSDAELERVIRHGIARDGRAVVIMPSSMYAPLSDADLASVIAYLRSIPPVEHDLPTRRIGPMGRLGLVLGKFHVEPAVIDHAAAHPAIAPKSDRLAYGRYLALTSCTECHGLDLRGQPGETPPLTLASAYSDSEFRQFFQTGKALGGRELKLMSDMARERFASLTDDEVAALLGYLKTLNAPAQ